MVTEHDLNQLLKVYDLDKNSKCRILDLRALAAYLLTLISISLLVYLNFFDKSRVYNRFQLLNQ